MRHLILSMAFLGLGGCVASIPPVEVTRFHLGSQPAAGGFVIEAVGPAAETLEFRTYAAAVERELVRLGYAAQGNPTYRIILTKEQRTRDVAARSPVTIGVGGGTFGSGVGLGVGTSFGLGARSRTIVHTRLSVQMKRVRDSVVVWEGRAETEAPGSAPASQPGLAAEKLARALFQGFPGESGRTIRVP